MKAAAIALILALLTACGGGDPEDYPDSPNRFVGPPDCSTGVCK